MKSNFTKEMAYINCTTTDTEYNDPYEYTSIGTNLYSLNAEGFIPWAVDGSVCGNAMVNSLITSGEISQKPTQEELDQYREIFTNYVHSTDFDAATGWGTLLETMTANPSIFTNPARAMSFKGGR